MSSVTHHKIRPRDIIRKRNQRLKAVLLTILILGLSAFGYSWYQHRNWVSTDDAFVAGHLITVKAQTEGSIVEILAENTQTVTAGDVLVRLDGTHAKIALEEAEAELAKTIRDIVSLTAQVDTLDQRIALRKASLDTVSHDLKRFIAAAQEGAVSEQDVQHAKDRMRELEASIRETKAEKKSVLAQISGTTLARHPAVEKAKSRIKKSYLDYQRRHILAPVSGVIANRRAHAGDNVKPGSSLLVIVPLENVWVEANFLETQIAAIQPGQMAEIKVDAYGSERLYHGKVVGLSPGTGSIFAVLPTNNATGNFIHIAERVPVRIRLDPEELKAKPLLPGLSTLTRIQISEAGEGDVSASVKVEDKAYQTAIYDEELDGIEQRIQKIIDQNLIRQHD